MRILIACESSGTSREAFRKLGHDAWSCDILPADDGSEFHIQGDAVQTAYEGDWDMMIAHPPCTYLSNSGVRWLHSDPTRWDKMRDGATFFKRLLNAPIPKIAVENPIIHKYAKEIIGESYTQTIQPWQFGHTETKRTCLWLKGLPKLEETENVYDEMMKLPKKERNRIHYASPGKDRWKIRSKTFDGIAQAFANQWGTLDTVPTK